MKAVDAVAEVLDFARARTGLSNVTVSLCLGRPWPRHFALR